MDTTDSPAFSTSIPPSDLARQLACNNPPLLIDVRKNEAFAASDHTLPGALRRDPLLLDDWAAKLPPAAAVLVYCVHGHEVSQTVQRGLQQQGINARFLQGGIEGWRAAGLPVMPKASASATRWVTRERPKIDRIACPWLVRRFIDAQAQFFYVPSAQVRSVASVQCAMPFDVNADVADTLFTHQGEYCSFDAFVRHYRLGADSALALLARIVRGADTDRLDLAPQSAGLLALSLGMSRNVPDDLALLDAMLPLYDALYAWCREAVAGTDERHNWKPA